MREALLHTLADHQHLQQQRQQHQAPRSHQPLPPRPLAPQQPQQHRQQSLGEIGLSLRSRRGRAVLEPSLGTALLAESHTADSPVSPVPRTAGAWTAAAQGGGGQLGELGSGHSEEGAPGPAAGVAADAQPPAEVGLKSSLQPGDEACGTLPQPPLPPPAPATWPQQVAPPHPPTADPLQPTNQPHLPSLQPHSQLYRSPSLSSTSSSIARRGAAVEGGPSAQLPSRGPSLGLVPGLNDRSRPGNGLDPDHTADIALAVSGRALGIVPGVNDRPRTAGAAALEDPSPDRPPSEGLHTWQQDACSEQEQ